MDNGTTAERKMNIPHPEVWSMAVRLQEACLKYVLHSTVEDNSLTFGTIEFRGSAGGYVKEVETAVYDNPFLLSPFGRQTVVVDSDRFLLVPDEFAPNGDMEECRRYYDFIYPDDRRALVADRIEEAGLTVVCGIDPSLDSFLRRTFCNPPVTHCLSPMIRFFKQRDSFGGRNKMFVYFNGDKVEIVAMKDGKTVFANLFPAGNADDAFYYVMNAWRQSRMDAAADEMHVVGDRNMKTELLPRLRAHLKRVVQVVFPAELLRLGSNAMSAPFDLISLSLCG